MPPSRAPDVIESTPRKDEKAVASKSPQSWSLANSSMSEEEDNDFDEPDSIESFIPEYLQQLILPYHGDFCHTSIFDYRLVAQVMSEGFLPIAYRNVLLPKLHLQRSVVSLPGDLHISKSVRKKAKKFTVKINSDFTGVVQGCHEQHAQCWLVPPLTKAFEKIHQATKFGHGVQVHVFQNSMPTDRIVQVRLYSMEVYNENSELIAGELGYTVGTIFTSLTGFSTQDSAGSVQLAALGQLLCTSGFQLWDLGMDMDYKQRLGAHLMRRTEYVEQVVRVRETSCKLPSSKLGWCARSVIDGSPTQP